MHCLQERSGGMRTTVRQPLPLFRKGDFVPAAGGPAARIDGTALYQPRGAEHGEVMWPGAGVYLKIDIGFILQSCL